MRIGFPVIFIRNGVEFAGLVASSSPRLDQVPLEDLNSPLTREQRFNQLRCNIAFWDPEVRGWRQADNVCYLSIDKDIPPEGDFYSEVGAPDAGERIELRAAQAEHARRMEEGRRAFEALPPEEQARIRAENAANDTRSSGMGAAGSFTATAEGHSGNELAPAELRSPDPVDPEPAPTSADTATELAVDDALDAGEGR